MCCFLLNQPAVQRNVWLLNEIFSKSHQNRESVNKQLFLISKGSLLFAGLRVDAGAALQLCVLSVGP